MLMLRLLYQVYIRSFSNVNATYVLAKKGFILLPNYLKKRFIPGFSPLCIYYRWDCLDIMTGYLAFNMSTP